VALASFALPRLLPAAWVALALTITLTSGSYDWGRFSAGSPVSDRTAATAS